MYIIYIHTYIRLFWSFLLSSASHSAIPDPPPKTQVSVLEEVIAAFLVEAEDHSLNLSPPIPQRTPGVGHAAVEDLHARPPREGVDADAPPNAKRSIFAGGGDDEGGTNAGARKASPPLDLAGAGPQRSSQGIDGVGQSQSPGDWNSSSWGVNSVSSPAGACASPPTGGTLSVASPGWGLSVESPNCGMLYRSLKEEDIAALQAQLRTRLGHRSDMPATGVYEIDEETSTPRPSITPRVSLSMRPRTPRDDVLFSPRLDGSGGMRYGTGDWGSQARGK